MIFSVSPARRLKGAVALPASKSYSIRAFMIALCGGRSFIYSPSNCDDVLSAMRVAKSLGAKIRRLSKNQYEVKAGVSQRIKNVNVGESGTVLRFVLPLLALRGQAVKVTGQGTLRGRPNRHLISLLQAQGVNIRGQGSKHSIPIELRGGCLKGGTMAISGSLSSQFISSLLIACPQISKDTRLMIRGPRLVSGDYLEMTLQVLKRAGVKIVRKGERKFFIPGGQEFKGLKNFEVPSDSGLAAFLLAAGILVPSDVTMNGILRRDLIQADSRIFDILKKMGGRFSMTEKHIRIRGPFALKGGEFSLEAAPDLVPIVTVLALFAKGRTRIYNIAHARVKESDRISDLRWELLKIGAHIEEGPNEIRIYPRKAYRSSVLLDPHHDHRLAMAFSVLGLKIGVRVKDIECAAKSYPDFVRDFRKLGVRAVLKKF